MHVKIAIIKKQGIDVSSYESALKKTFLLDQKNPDIVFVFGGDGSMLLSEHQYPGIPKIGFSKGRLAFLMQEECAQLKEVLRRIEKGDFVVEPQFDGGENFSHGLARVSLGGRYWHGGLARGGKIGYIDKKGRYVWEPTD